MSRRIQYESIPAKSILNPVKAPSMPFEWSINPYRGCQHGCSFCYARSTHSFLGVSADDTFQNHIFLKSNAAETLEAQLLKMSRSKKGLKQLGSVAIGTATDPYQQVEGKAQVTRQCLEVLAKYEIPVSITTRSPLILRDIDLLQKLNVTSINISINTLNTTVWKNFEPSTPSPKQRLETVKSLTEAGIPTGVFVAPILPMITDGREDLRSVIEHSANSGAHFVRSSFLRLSTNEVKVWFFQTLERHYPHLVAKYAEIYQTSAYAPSRYREPVKKAFQSLLEQYGLTEIETFKPVHKLEAPEPLSSSPCSEPVQLSFSF